MSKNARGSKSAKTREALLKIAGVSETENEGGRSTGGSKVKSAGDVNVKSADDGKVRSTSVGKTENKGGSKVKSSGDGKVRSASAGKTESKGDGKVKSADDGKIKSGDGKTKSSGGRVKSAGEKKAKGEGSKKVKRKNDSREDPHGEIKPERQSNKTPQVLKLLEQDKSSSNPVILAGKSRIPRQLSGREPLSRLFRRQMGDEFSDIEGTVVVNITQMAIEFLAPEILDRFNACSCDICVEEFSRIIAERVPVRFARISKGSQYRGSHELTERMEPARKMVLSEMIKELIGNKKRCFHDE